MEQKKFEAMLILIVPQVINLIVQNYEVDEIKATKDFYESELYSLLEQEDTKLWQLSPINLFNLYDDEQKTGKITFPEG